VPSLWLSTVAIDDGALHGVAEATMAHVFSPRSCGLVTLREGVALTGADFVELTAEGGGGHAAISHDTHDAAFAAAQW
jgi:amidohydrolase